LRTTIVRVTPAKIEHEYRLFRGQELLAQGNVTLAVIDREGRVKRVPETLQIEEG
jgi:acyl-CoA thioester hydrolase